jgi:hypothetical protein
MWNLKDKNVFTATFNPSFWTACRDAYCLFYRDSLFLLGWSLRPTQENNWRLIQTNRNAWWETDTRGKLWDKKPRSGSIPLSLPCCLGDHFPCNRPIQLSQFLNLHTSTLNMEAKCSSKTQVSAYKIIGCHNPQDHNLDHRQLKKGKKKHLKTYTKYLS